MVYGDLAIFSPSRMPYTASYEPIPLRKDQMMRQIKFQDAQAKQAWKAVVTFILMKAGFWFLLTAALRWAYKDELNAAKSNKN